MDIFFSSLWNVLEDTGLTPSNRWQLLVWSFSTAIEIWEDALCVVGILSWTIQLFFLHKTQRCYSWCLSDHRTRIPTREKHEVTAIWEKTHNFLYSNQKTFIFCSVDWSNSFILTSPSHTDYSLSSQSPLVLILSIFTPQPLVSHIQADCENLRVFYLWI